MRFQMVVLTAFLWAATSPVSTVRAQEQAPPAGCNTPEYRQFDFWLGRWEVTVDGKQAGDNVISKEEGGCLIVERWADVAGGTGQSYNYYEPHSKSWRQVWVSDYMTIDYSGGFDDDGSMVLEGHVVYRHNGQRVPILGRWTPLEDGTVRQYVEQFDDTKGAMVPIFTGIYKRSAED